MPTDLFNISGKPPTDLKRHGLANVTMESSIYRLVVQPILLPLQPLLFLCVCVCVWRGYKIRIYDLQYCIHYHF